MDRPEPRAQKVARMNYWLIKSEPEECSVDDVLAAKKSMIPWVGVRNYQARTFMRDSMQIGDSVLFYHSTCDQPGIVGIAQSASAAYPDPTQFDPNSPDEDAKPKSEERRWLLVDVQVLKKIPNITLAALRERPELVDMLLLKKGNRLSITPVEPRHWKVVLKIK